MAEDNESKECQDLWSEVFSPVSTSMETEVEFFALVKGTRQFILPPKKKCRQEKSFAEGANWRLFPPLLRICY